MALLSWPLCVLNPPRTSADPVAFTRGGGKSINGIERTVRTDRGFWEITLSEITIRSQAQKQTWNAIRTGLGGRAGLIAVVVKSWDSAPYISQPTYTHGAPIFERRFRTPHGDDLTPFSDGSLHSQGAVDIEVAEAVNIGAVVIKLRAIRAAPKLSGIRFSYNHAMYETGPALDVTGDVWTLPIFPSIRAPIPVDVGVEVEEPTCLCHLAEDRGMDLPEGQRLWENVSVTFTEAVDHWNDIAGVPIWP